MNFYIWYIYMPKPSLQSLIIEYLFYRSFLYTVEIYTKTTNFSEAWYIAISHFTPLHSLYLQRRSCYGMYLWSQYILELALFRWNKENTVKAGKVIDPYLSQEIPLRNSRTVLKVCVFRCRLKLSDLWKIFRWCEFSNVASENLGVSKYIHNRYICYLFPLCVFSKVA